MTREQFALLRRRIDVEVSWIRSLRASVEDVRQHDAPYAKQLQEAIDKLDALHRGS